MSITSADVMDASAALLNDVEKTTFTYVVQIPYLNIALDELREVMEQNNVPYTNEVTTSIIVTAGDLSSDVPDDLIEIQQLWERQNGSSDDYVPMVKCEFLPPYIQMVESLVFWAWINQELRFIGATTDRQLRMDYIARRINNITSSTDTIGLINAKSFLNYRTAALCAEFVGENPERAQSLNADALMAIDRFLGINTKGRQSIYTRRRPFMAAYRVRGMI